MKINELIGKLQEIATAHPDAIVLIDYPGQEMPVDDVEYLEPDNCVVLQ